MRWSGTQTRTTHLAQRRKHRSKDLVILEKEFKNVSNQVYIMTDDGTYGEKGLVTKKLEELLNKDHYDLVFAVGPLIMMKYVSLTCNKYNTKVVVSMNPIMIDGSGMCGCCRILVDGKMRFACVDGPDFDGSKIDFDDAIKRNQMYLEKEKKAREDNCNLLKKAQ